MNGRDAGAARYSPMLAPLPPDAFAGDDMFATLKTWARAARRDTHALYLAARDPRVPWYAKAVAAAVAAYAVSPIDLIPDFIPVVGYLDDLIIVPLGIVLAVQLVPRAIMAEHRARAAAVAARPISRSAATVVIGIWVLLGAGAFAILVHYVAGH